jgi:conjugative relaxase-like TrwC/TraI family protein
LVATWNPAASAAYYRNQTEYYLGGVEPAGRWFAPGGDFGVIDDAIADTRVFERLYHGLDANGKHLIGGRSHPSRLRVGAYDYTFSAPKSVALAWAFAEPELKRQIEAAQYHAVRDALALLEHEATFTRRGHKGARVERVPLTATLFQHGESRPVAHEDGRFFGDPNLHTHCVIFNLATRGDGSVGALFSTVQRDWKLAVGAFYHASLAARLAEVGYSIDRVGKNGVFELTGVDPALIDYFSARRDEIEDELRNHGATSGEATAFAAAIAKATRGGKQEAISRQRDDLWREAAASRGVEVATFSQSLVTNAPTLTLEACERLLVERLAALPAQLTETESVIDRRALVRAVAAALVGTGLPSERVASGVDRLIEVGAVVEIGRDAIGVARYSTPEMIAVEREIVACTTRLATHASFSLEPDTLSELCAAANLSAEQTQAALAATSGAAVAVAEGAPGSGKTTMLRPIVEAYKEAGFRVYGAATAWRVANALRDDLAIESRAIASWLERAKYGALLDPRSVLVVDEAGLIASRDMLQLLRHVEQAGTKILLVGDRKQLQAIAAGSGLTLVARAVEAARVDTIVRQHDIWVRDAIQALGKGKALEALEAFEERGHVIETRGTKATLDALVARWKAAREAGEEPLILARTNAQVGQISRAIRAELRARGEIVGPEVVLNARTPSGHPTTLALAAGDRVRFLARNDTLSVVNGTTATILRVEGPADAASPANPARLVADIAGREVAFDPLLLADATGRTALGWAWASTVFGSQGSTVDRAVVWLDSGFDRHAAYVAASRARIAPDFLVDVAALERQVAAELPLDAAPIEALSAQRRAWLAARLSRAHFKETTLDAMDLTGERCQAEAPQRGVNSRQWERAAASEPSLG